MTPKSHQRAERQMKKAWAVEKKQMSGGPKTKPVKKSK
jgi:hypothetical protein